MERLFYPEDEKIYPWLAMLLESYSITDHGVSAAIETETTTDRQLACHQRCTACCRTHQSIPVTPIELVGISWFAMEKTYGLICDTLIAQLQAYQMGNACPFLVDDVYSIYEVRPYACRQFNVFNQICEEGEDAYYTRKQDVLTPAQNSIDKAYYTTFPFYGLEQNEENSLKIRDGEIHKIIHVLQEQNWKVLQKRGLHIIKKIPRLIHATLT